MKKPQFSPRIFRVILVILILAICGLGIVGYFVLSGYINDYALEVSTKRTEAEVGENRLKEYSNLEIALKQYTTERERASQVVAEKQQYKYQDEVVRAISDLAGRNGIAISSIEFNVKPTKSSSSSSRSSASSSSSATSNSSSSSSGSTAASSNPLAPSTVGTENDPDAGGTTTVSVPSTNITITPKPPMSYEGFIGFLYDLEFNLTRMQIASLNIQNQPTGQSKGLTTSTISMEVYIK